MARKDFQKGMEAGAKPFEDKFAQQSSEFKKTADGINKKLDGIHAVTDAIIDELNGMQKKQLYDLNTVVDIGTLGSDEKELLTAILYTLANMTDYVTEGQQAFIRSVKAYLGVTNVQTSVDLSCIENIENINDQKAVLQTVLTFLFIENQDHGYMDEYADVIEYFSVNNKGIKQIQNCIDQIFNATGVQGLIEMYGYQPPVPEPASKTAAEEAEEELPPSPPICEKCADIMGALVSDSAKYADMGEYFIAFFNDKFYKVFKSDGKTDVLKTVVDEWVYRLYKVDADRILAHIYDGRDKSFLINCLTGKTEQIDLPEMYSGSNCCNSEKIFFKGEYLCEYDIKTKSTKPILQNGERIDREPGSLVGTKLFINDRDHDKLCVYDYTTGETTDICTFDDYDFLTDTSITNEAGTFRVVLNNEIIQFVNKDEWIFTGHFSGGPVADGILVYRFNYAKQLAVKTEVIPGSVEGLTISDGWLYYVNVDTDGAISRYHLSTGQTELLLPESSAIYCQTEGVFKKRISYSVSPDVNFVAFGDWCYYSSNDDDCMKLSIKNHTETCHPTESILEELKKAAEESE